jgi:hypothetical protein
VSYLRSSQLPPKWTDSVDVDVEVDASFASSLMEWMELEKRAFASGPPQALNLWTVLCMSEHEFGLLNVSWESYYVVSSI